MDIVKMVKISETLRTCREQGIFLHGQEGWQKLVAQWQPIFEAVMKKHDCELMKAAIILIQGAQDHPDAGMLTHLLAGVACELAEPTNAAPEPGTSKVSDTSSEVHS